MLRNKFIGKFTQSDGGKQIDAIYFDGRKDQILFQHNDTGRLTYLKEQHYVLVGQPHSEYLTYLTLQSGNVAAISEAILEFTGKYNIDDELNVIGCDSTTVNTCSMEGVIHPTEETSGTG